MTTMTHNSTTAQQTTELPKLTSEFALVALMVAGVLAAVVGVVASTPALTTPALTITAGLMVAILGPVLTWTEVLSSER